ncbi:MAG: hypothetical protein QNJ97_09890 [Myxococcota bacterium]|nr:hypothetical protein [Myxococcota bacterium]
MKPNFTIATLMLICILDGACQGKAEDPGIGQHEGVSECGGFDAQSRKDDPSDLTQKLSWMATELPDNQGYTVAFLHQNLCLNCCGEHGVKIFYNEQSDLYSIQESDAPLLTSDGQYDRCLCDCLYDYSVELPGVTATKITVELVLDITDASPDSSPTYPHQLWQGMLDLTQGEGEIIIGENGSGCI